MYRYRTFVLCCHQILISKTHPPASVGLQFSDFKFQNGYRLKSKLTGRRIQTEVQTRYSMQNVSHHVQLLPTNRTHDSREVILRPNPNNSTSVRYRPIPKVHQHFFSVKRPGHMIQTYIQNSTIPLTNVQYRFPKTTSAVVKHFYCATPTLVLRYVDKGPTLPTRNGAYYY